MTGAAEAPGEGVVGSGPITVGAARATLTAPGAAYELHEVVVAGKSVHCYRNAPPHLRAVFESTREYGDRDAVVYEDERLTYAQQYAAVARTATTLREGFGIGRGDRVVLAMRNLPEFVIAFWACQVIGAVAVPLNAWWTGQELAWAIADADPALAVMDGERWRRLRDAGFPMTGLPVVVTRAEEDLAGAIPWREIVPDHTGTGELPDCDIGPDDPATILYTSGTTGRPKGAVGTGRNHCSLLMAAGFQGEVGRLTQPSPPRREPSQPALLNPFPFFHIGGLSSMYLAGSGGVKQVLMYKWDTARALEICARERITNLAVVPTMLRRMLQGLAAETYDLSAVTAIGIGGAPGAAELSDAAAARFGSGVSINHGYGLTETTSSACQHNGASFAARPDSVGLPTPGTAIRIVTEDGTDRPAGAAGEIWVRGPQVVAGYWNDPAATATAFQDGWFRAGDIGALDQEGYLTVLDRAKDVIIRGGENVYPAEIEAVLHDHPAVQEAAVVGLPDHDLGEIVAAVVVPAGSAAVTGEELREHARRGLAAFKVPAVVVVRDAPLPRNATGKILKRLLREELAAAG
ncbi:class I adenylate-forming enzyme family protein [Actinomadura rugatobispora]|uniref:Class I adenylate-forming enzyme family protein n=1 Tax=Actinomadura rugatobispora TaxID=1994 RepID=A0ABW0ZUR0_9ACTN|nr:class I adenylate-forming enzyme family protein [Actinomadura rugatobispora]